MEKQQYDSALLMSDPAFSKVVIEREYYKAISDLLHMLVEMLKQGQELRADLIAEHASFIQFQKEKLSAL